MEVVCCGIDYKIKLRFYQSCCGDNAVELYAHIIAIAVCGAFHQVTGISKRYRCIIQINIGKVIFMICLYSCSSINGCAITKIYRISSSAVYSKKIAAIPYAIARPHCMKADQFLLSNGWCRKCRPCRIPHPWRRLSNSTSA